MNTRKKQKLLSLLRQYKISNGGRLNQEDIKLNKIKKGSVIKFFRPGQYDNQYQAKVIDMVGTSTQDFAVVKDNGRKRNVQFSHITDVIKY